jgi:hypothetical protein
MTTSTHKFTSWELCPLDGVGFHVVLDCVLRPFFGFFFACYFFPNFEITYKTFTTYLLGPTNQLRTNSPPSFTNLPPKSTPRFLT